MGLDSLLPSSVGLHQGPGLGGGCCSGCWHQGTSYCELLIFFFPQVPVLCVVVSLQNFICFCYQQGLQCPSLSTFGYQQLRCFLSSNRTNWKCILGYVCMCSNARGKGSATEPQLQLCSICTCVSLLLLCLCLWGVLGMERKTPHILLRSHISAPF